MIPKVDSQSNQYVANTYMQSQIQTFASRAGELAKEILNEKNSSSSSSSSSQSSGQTVIIRHYYSTPWYSPFCFYPQPVYVGPSSPREDENAMRLLVGVVAAVVGGFALYAIGSAIPRYQDSEREYVDAQEFDHYLNSSDALAENSDLIQEAKHLVHLKERVCRRIHNSALADLVLRIGVAVGCGFALAAAIAVGTGPLMVAGVIATLMAGGAMLFKWGYEQSDKSNLRDAQWMLESVKRLHTL